MIRSRRIASGIMGVLAMVLALPAIGAPLPDASHVEEDMLPLVEGLTPRHGTIDLGNGLATLVTPKGFGYLPQPQTDILLHNVIGYRGTINNLGSLVPDAVKLGSPATWAAVISYKASGHLLTDKLHHPDSLYLMHELTAQNNDRNAKLRGLGVPNGGIDLIGWAAKPFYLEQSHAFYWGLEIQEQDTKRHLVDYFMRIPGRRGTLELNLDGYFELLPMLQHNALPLLSCMHFNPGNRYEDFDAARDPRTGYDAYDVILGHTAPRKAAPAQISASAPPDRLKGMLIVVLLGTSLVILQTIRKKNPKSANPDLERGDPTEPPAL